MRELMHSLFAPEIGALARALTTPDALTVGAIYITVWTALVLALVWVIDFSARRSERREREARELERTEALARIRSELDGSRFHFVREG